jgi:hypothetical protein
VVEKEDDTELSPVEEEDDTDVEDVECVEDGVSIIYFYHPFNHY